MSLIGGPAPEEDPVDPDLPEHLRACATGTWTDLIFRMKIHTTRKAVALALAFHADGDGSSVFPGARRIGHMVNRSEDVAADHIKALQADGMLYLVRAGGGRGGDPNVYRLTRPADITTLPLWLDPDMYRADAPPPPHRKHQAPTPAVRQEHQAPAPDVPAERQAPTPAVPAEHPAPAPAVPAADGAPAPAEAAEHPAPAPGETTEQPVWTPDIPAEQQAPAPAIPQEHPVPAPVETGEHPAPAPVIDPVDNFGPAETTGVSTNNDRCFGEEYPVPVPPDLTNTYPPDQTTPGSPQATTSPAPGPDSPTAGGPEHRPSLLAAAILAGDGTVPSFVDGPAELAAAAAALSASGASAYWRVQARRALADRGRTGASHQFVTIVAAELYRRAPTTTDTPNGTP